MTNEIPHRRESDQPTTTGVKVMDRTIATAMLVGIIGFLYQLSEILTRHSDWLEMRSTVAVGEILFALVCGLGAFAAALGLNVESLLKGFRH